MGSKAKAPGKGKIAILPFARPTFDVAFAEERLAAMLAALERAGAELTGPRQLLLDPDAARAAIADLSASVPDQVLVLQVTFTDAGMVAEAARAFSGLM